MSAARIPIQRSIIVWLTMVFIISVIQPSYAQSNPIQLSHTGQNLGMARTDGVFLGDIDRDGDLDILTQDNNYGPSQIWLNNGSATMSNGGQIGEQYEMLPLFGDVDGDGDLDAVSRVVRRNNGSGNFTVVNTNDTDFWPLTSGRDYRKLGDIDGDGDLDYVSTVGTWTNNGSGIFSRSATLNAPLKPLKLADIDRDNDLDIIVLDSVLFGLRIWRNNGQGVFTADPPQILSSFENFTTFTIGDIDNDGDPDIVTGGLATAVRAFLNDGSGTFNLSVQRVALTVVAYDIALGDLDGDRDLDLLIARGEQRDAVYRNDGSSFSQDWVSPFADNSWVAVLGDLNGDGQLDAVTGNMGSLFTENGAPDRVFLNTTPRSSPRIIANVAPRQSGSTMVVEALFLPPNTAVSLSMNGLLAVSRTFTTDATGSLTFLITTTGASDGFYTLELQVENEPQPLRLSFVLRATSPLILEQRTGAIEVALPANSGRPINDRYLALVRR